MRSVDLVDESVNALVALAQRGDKHALEQLLTLVRLGVLRFLLAQGCTTHDAEDLTQEVCVAVLGVVPRWRESGRSFWGFVFTTTRNKLVDGHRRARRACIDGSVDDFADVLSETGPGPEDVAVTSDANARLHAVLAQLSRTQRDVIVLRVVVGLTTAETADALGLAPGSVHVLQHRAVGRLRQLLGAELAGSAS